MATTLEDFREAHRGLDALLSAYLVAHRAALPSQLNVLDLAAWSVEEQQRLAGTKLYIGSINAGSISIAGSSDTLATPQKQTIFPSE